VPKHSLFPLSRPASRLRHIQADGLTRLGRFSLFAMAALYVAAGLNHFVAPGFYLSIMPPYIPAPRLMVQASGVAEVLLGLALLPTATRRWAGWGIVGLLVVFFVVHIDMLVRAEAYPDIPFPVLVLRLPLQVLLIYWAERATRPIRNRT